MQRRLVSKDASSSDLSSIRIHQSICLGKCKMTLCMIRLARLAYQVIANTVLFGSVILCCVLKTQKRLITLIELHALFHDSHDLHLVHKS